MEDVERIRPNDLYYYSEMDKKKKISGQVVDLENREVVVDHCSS